MKLVRKGGGGKRTKKFDPRIYIEGRRSRGEKTTIGGKRGRGRKEEN